MSNTVELLFKIKADAADVKSTLAQVRADLSQTAQAQKNVNQGELSAHQQLTAVASLQRQRSAALISDWKRTETAAANLAKGVTPVGENLQKVTDIMQALGSSSAALQGPMGGVASRLRSLGAVASEAGGGLGLVGAGVGALLVASVAASVGIYKLVTASAEATGKLYDLSQQTGFSVETLSALKNAAETSGGSIETVAGALGIFQRHMEEASEGNKEASRLFKTLNIDIHDNEKALRDAFAILSKLPAGAQQTALSMKLFGRSGREVQGIFKETGGDIDKFMDRLREMGLLITSEAARKGDQLSDSITILGQQFDATGRVVANEFAPIVAEALGDFSGWLRDNQKEIAATAHDVAGLVKDIGGLAKFIASITPIVLQIKAVYSAVGGGGGGDIMNMPDKGGTTLGNSRFSQLWDWWSRGRDTGTPLMARADTSGPNQTAAQIEATRRANADAQKKEADAQTDLQNRLKSLGKSGGGKKGPKDTALQDEFEAEKKAIEERENAYREETERLKHEYDLRHIAFAEYIAGERAANEARLNGILDEIDREQAAIDAALAKKTIKQDDYSKKNAELEAQTRKAVRESKKEEDRIDDEDYKSRLSALQQFHARRLELDEKDAAARLAEVQDAEKQTTKTHFTAAVEQIDIEQGVLTTRRDLLREQIKIAREGSDEYVKVTHQIQLQTKEQEAFTAEAARRTRDARQKDTDEAAAARQKDLDNLASYNEAYGRLALTGLAVEEEISQLKIDLLRATGASILRIVQAQITQRQAAEDVRHRQELNRIDSEYRKTLEAADKTEHRWIQMVAALKKRNQDIEAENKRHELAERTQAAEAVKEKTLAGPAGGFLSGLQTGQLAQLEKGVQSFADIATVAFSAVGAAVNGLAQGVGQLVQNWVLMGEAGPNAMRKMVASVLAGVAAQAATLAVMELAMAFATLIPGLIPTALYGTAAQHFKAAALFGSIALVSGLAGRAIAGNSFQQSSGSTSSGAGGSTSSNAAPRSTGPPQTIDIGRKQAQAPLVVHLVVEHKPSTMFETHIVKAIVKDRDHNGPIRDLIVREIGR
jgi:hypothetical protein